MNIFSVSHHAQKAPRVNLPDAAPEISEEPRRRAAVIVNSVTEYRSLSRFAKATQAAPSFFYSYHRTFGSFRRPAFSALRPSIKLTCGGRTRTFCWKGVTDCGDLDIGAEASMRGGGLFMNIHRQCGRMRADAGFLTRGTACCRILETSQSSASNAQSSRRYRLTGPPVRSSAHCNYLSA